MQGHIPSTGGMTKQKISEKNQVFLASPRNGALAGGGEVITLKETRARYGLGGGLDFFPLHLSQTEAKSYILFAAQSPANSIV